VLGNTLGLLEHYLNLVSARQRLTAANIANADTPGYRTKDIDFTSELSSVLGVGAARPVEVQGLVVKNDGNNVSLDRESRLLAENALRFNIAANLLRSQLNTIRMAVREGRNA
jgi:flagellar basal-body rod protein FlgB